MEHNEAVICCRLIAAFLVSDDDVSEEEHTFFMGMMESIGLSEDEQQAALSIVPGREDIQRMAEEVAPEIREGLLEALVQAALLDGEFSDDEKGFVRHVAHAMGLPPEAVEKAWIRTLVRERDEE